jgi:hypothetical protein
MMMDPASICMQSELVSSTEATPTVVSAVVQRGRYHAHSQHELTGALDF